MRKAIIIFTALLFTHSAWASSSFTVQITAHVDPFCRINAPDDVPIQLTNGAAQIGIVHEICNTANGYDVQASFSNLSGGELNVAGQNYAIDDSGEALRGSSQPNIQDLNWQIADATLVEPSAPVIMRVTITPR